MTATKRKKKASAALAHADRPIRLAGIHVAPSSLRMVVIDIEGEPTTVVALLQALVRKASP